MPVFIPKPVITALVGLLFLLGSMSLTFGGVKGPLIGAFLWAVSADYGWIIKDSSPCHACFLLGWGLPWAMLTLASLGKKYKVSWRWPKR